MYSHLCASGTEYWFEKPSFLGLKEPKNLQSSNLIQIRQISYVNRDFWVLTSRHSLNENDVTWRTVYRMFFVDLKIRVDLLCTLNLQKPKKTFNTVRLHMGTPPSYMRRYRQFCLIFCYVLQRLCSRKCLLSSSEDMVTVATTGNFK